MIHCRLSILLLIILAMTIGKGFAQEQQWSVHTWIEKLSVKKDPKGKIFKSVLEEISNLDTMTRCDVLQILHRQKTSSGQRYKIRASFIINFLAHNLLYCPFQIDWLEESKSMELLAYEVNDPFLIMIAHRILASDYLNLNEFGFSSYYYQLVFNNPLLPYSPDLNQPFNEYLLGDLLYRTNEYQNSILHLRRVPELNRQAIHENKDTFNTIDWMFYWNTKGLCYEKLNMFDSAMTAFNQALYFTNRNKHPGWIGLVQGNRGQIFLHQGQLDSAEILLNMDIHASIRDSQQFADNAANSLQLLSRIYTMRGQPMEALRVLRRAQQLLYQLPSKSIQANLTFAFMLAFEKLGRADSVLAYSNRYTVLRDSIEHQAASNKEEFVNLRLENTLSIHKIESLHKERNRINLIRNFSIVLALLAGALSYLFLNRQRLKMKLHEQQTLEAKNKAEHEMMEAKSKLEFFTQHLIEKNNLVETLQHQLNQKTLDDQQLQVISMLSQHTILTDEDWDRFRHLFEKVYPGFFHNLKIKAPDITLAEQRMAALTKLHLSSKEASYLLGISHASVNKTKLRLRTRLALETDADLDAYLA